MSLVLAFQYLGTDGSQEPFTALAAAFESAQRFLAPTGLLALPCFVFCFSVMQGIELRAFLILLETYTPNP